MRTKYKKQETVRVIALVMQQASNESNLKRAHGESYTPRAQSNIVAILKQRTHTFRFDRLKFVVL